MKKRILKKVIPILCIIVLYIATTEVLRYLIVDDTKSYTRLMLHDMYTEESNIDVLFVGASLVYRSLVPEIADQYFGTSTFNMGSSSQGMDASLVLIKEAMKYHDIKHIYLEVSYDIALLEDNQDRTQMTSTYIVSDYLRPSFGKVKYLLQASSSEHYINSFILARRNWEKLFDYEYMEDLWKKKNTENYRNYQWTYEEDALEYYVERGFVANDSEMQEEDFRWNSKGYDRIKVEDISSDWIRYLGKIIDFCHENRISLTLFSAPRPEITLAGKENYDEYCAFIQKIAGEAHIDYFDFNLCKDEYFDSTDRTFFIDAAHLNTKGARKFTEVFSGFFTGQIEREKLFWNTYEEKLGQREPMVYGIAGPADNDDHDQVLFKIISNRKAGMAYRIAAVPQEGEYRLIQDFEENKDFALPVGEEGVLEITWKMAEQPAEEHNLEFIY